MTVKNYNQALVTVLADGVPQLGINEGDAIRVIPNAESSALTTGVYETSTSFSTDNSGTFEIDYKPGSLSLIQLKRLHRNQKTFRARIFDIELITGVGDPVSLQGCSIMDIGTTTTAGKVMQPRTVVFNVQKVDETI